MLYPENEESRKSISPKDEVKQIVQEFYCTNAISRQAPGKRDVKSVKDPTTGKREKIAIRHMLMNIMDAYFEFTKQHPQVKCSKTLFFKHRPQFVLPAGKTPFNVCVRKKHLNFSFHTEALYANCEGFPYDYKIFLSQMYCNVDDENCMLNNCSGCQFDSQIFLSTDINLQVSIPVQQWKNVDGFLQVIEINISVIDVIVRLNKELPNFKKHCYIKKVQSNYFEACKNLAENKDVVVQIDFSENANLSFQNEIQSAHWKKKVTIFTCCIWYMRKVESLAIISDDLNHSKYAVWSFLKIIATRIKQKYPKVLSLKIFSDNAASQFRSKFTISNLCYLDEDLGFSCVEWDTFAVSHGKGVVDGVGASIKNTILTKVKSVNLHLHTAKEYYSAAKNFCKKATILFVPEKDVQVNEKFLASRFDKVRKIKYISSEGTKLGLSLFHAFRKSDASYLLAAQTSTSQFYKIEVFE